MTKIEKAKGKQVNLFSLSHRALYDSYSDSGAVATCNEAKVNQSLASGSIGQVAVSVGVRAKAMNFVRHTKRCQTQ